ncbi:hypothetical protein M0R45_014509 [Rubus argutus]|uniref:Uncharacterized protein n=1 Tax=Rubus argutus TaxID=59490 RepID=A0AAW1XLU1_RUBAR
METERKRRETSKKETEEGRDAGDQEIYSRLLAVAEIDASPEPEALTVKVETSPLSLVMTDSDGFVGSSPLSDLTFADCTESSSTWDNSGTKSYMLEKYPSEIVWASILS